MTTTTVSLTRPLPGRPAPTLACQQVGGCPARVTAMAILMMGLLVGAGLFCVWSRTEVVREGYALVGLNQELRRLAAEQERFKLEAASLRAPDRIEAIAKTQLGLQFPTPEQIRTVSYRAGRSRPGPALASRAVTKGGE